MVFLGVAIRVAGGRGGRGRAYLSIFLLEGFLDEGGDDIRQKRTAQLQAGIRVYLDQQGRQGVLDHEVHPQKLEVVLTS